MNLLIAPEVAWSAILALLSCLKILKVHRSPKRKSDLDLKCRCKKKQFQVVGLFEFVLLLITYVIPSHLRRVDRILWAPTSIHHHLVGPHFPFPPPVHALLHV